MRVLRMLAATALTGAALTLTALTATAAHATPDTDCADYPSRAVAQAQFDLHGGSPTNNWHGLDNDHDGQVCEHHRFPGQPTPPPNPGPSGCAVCSPAPSPSTSPQPPTTSAQPPAPPTRPQLPITGPGQTAVLIGLGGALLLVGIGLIGALRRRA